MEEKKKINLGLIVILLTIAVIAIIVMSIFMYKINSDKNDAIEKSTEYQAQINTLNETITTLQGKIGTISNTINNTPTVNTEVNDNVESNKETNDSKNIISDTIVETTTQDTTIINKPQENKEDEIIGKWNAYKAVNSQDGKETTNMSDIFGSSYARFGSYIELKNDGTFLDAIQPITDGSNSSNGTYNVERDYYKKGDCYIFLTYSDGNTKTLQQVYYDDNNTPYLVLQNLIGDYQISFKK